MSRFELHPQLVADTLPAGEFDLCTILLMNDNRFPWIILVPQIPDLREIHDLPPVEQIQLMGEIAHMSSEMQKAWGADKTNVATLGNMVPQLHVHIIMRYEGDAAWPGPVWGAGTPQPYDEAEAAQTLEMISGCLRVE